MRTAQSLIVSAALVLVSTLISTSQTPAQISSPQPLVTKPVDIHDLVTLHGNLHPLARAEFDSGVAPDNLPMERMLLVLKRSAEQEVALRQLLDDQQVKSSARYHRWLTPTQLGEQFGPADSDLQAITGWLTSRGFQVDHVSAGRSVVEFSGTAGLVREALGTEVHRFRVNGEEYWANASDPQIPAALASVIAGFASLNNFPVHPLVRKQGVFRGPRPINGALPLYTLPYACDTSSSGLCNFYLLGPTDFATVYNLLPLWNSGTNGTGQTIAIVGESNINPEDIAEFRTMFGLPPNAPNIIVNGPDPGLAGDETEADVDVEWSGAVATGATIDLVVSETTATTPGIDLSALYIVENNLAPVVSDSYGACEAYWGAGGNQFYSTIWEQAAAQGMTVLVGSGDSGSAGCDSPNLGEDYAVNGLAVNGVASTPFNVAVGGTEFNDSANPSLFWSPTNNVTTHADALSYVPESPWNDSCANAGLSGCANAATSDSGIFSAGADLAAGSGGPSSCVAPTGTFPGVTCSGGYAKPNWQTGSGVPNDMVRDIPDVSMFAGDSSTGSAYIMCETDITETCDISQMYWDFTMVGGTSVSAQVFAGIMALVNQRYGPQGNANYTLYPLAAQGGNSCVSNTAAASNTACVFYDIQTGNNSVICQEGTPNCSNSSTASGQYGVMVAGDPPSPAYASTAGFDLATGLGSVNITNLVNQWNSVSYTPTTTTLSPVPAVTPVSLTHGQPFSFSVSVAPSTGSSTPSGDISLITQSSSSTTATAVGPFTLSPSASFSGSTIMLPGGSYIVTAHYAGNGTLAGSTSSPGIPVVVGPESSRTFLHLVTFDNNGNLTSTNATAAPYGSQYAIRADVTNASGDLCASATSGLPVYGCPTGALTITPAPTETNPPQGSVPGSYSLNTQGYAEDLSLQQIPGPYNFVANYAGDNSYNASQGSATFAFTQNPTTTTWTNQVTGTVAGTSQYFEMWINTQDSNGAAPSGSVQFYNGSSPLGNPVPVSGTPYRVLEGFVFYAYATALQQETIPVGSDVITARYTGDTNYAPSTSAPITLTVTDFSMSMNPSSFNISAPGQSASSTITITPINGFTGNISLSVIALNYPPGMTFTFSPPYVTVSGSSPVTSTLTIATTAASATSSTFKRPVSPSPWPPIGLLFLLAGALAFGVQLSLNSSRRRAPALALGTALLVIGVVIACGGGGGSASLPPPAPNPSVSISPASLTFGPQNMDTTSPPQTVTLTSTGNANLNVANIFVTGIGIPEFSQTNACNSSLAAGATCSISVNFSPGNALGAGSGTLNIADNAGNSPQSVALTGTGIAPATPPGSYPIDISALENPDSHDLNVNVNVQ